jgi:hypothetical protein
VFATKLRHGMEINLLLVPLFLGLRTLLRERPLLVPYLVAAAIALVLTVLPRTAFVQQDDESRSHLLQLTLASASQPFLSIVSNRNGYTSDNPEYDAKLATFVFGPGYKRAYAADYFANTVALSDTRDLDLALKAVVARTPRLCALNVSTCLSGRVQMMLGTLQPSTRKGAMTFYDLGTIDPRCATSGRLPASLCEVLNTYVQAQKTDAQRQRVAALAHATERTGRFTLGAVTWNLLPAFLLLIASIALFAPRHPLWVVASFYVLQMALPFATITTNDYRYYYFLALYLPVFLPLCIGAAFMRRSTTADISAQSQGAGALV